MGILQSEEKEKMMTVRSVRVRTAPALNPLLFQNYKNIKRLMSLWFCLY